MGIEFHAAICASRSIGRHEDLANRTREWEARLPRRCGFGLLGAYAALTGFLRLAKLGVELRLEDPQARVVRVEIGKPLERLERIGNFLHCRLRRSHREEGVHIFRIEFEPLTSRPHDELETLGCQPVHSYEPQWRCSPA